jgi:hypothetical protein
VHVGERGESSSLLRATALAYKRMLVVGGFAIALLVCRRDQPVWVAWGVARWSQPVVSSLLCGCYLLPGLVA